MPQENYLNLVAEMTFLYKKLSLNWECLGFPKTQIDQWKVERLDDLSHMLQQKYKLNEIQITQALDFVQTSWDK